MTDINSPDNKELYTQYDWFSKAYTPLVQNAGDEFFLPGLQFILLGVSKNINPLMDKDSYFVTKIMIDKNHDIFFRSSEKTISTILDRALGKPNSRFNLNKLTDLEAKIITSFNDYMYNLISKNISPAPPTLKRTNFDVVHLTYLLKDNDTNTVSKFIITLPEVLLKPEIVTAKGEKFTNDNFKSSMIDITIVAGTTKFKLIDIKNIETGDVVVFDNSDSTRMRLKFKDYETDIKINPNLGLVMPFNENEGEEDMDSNAKLWDTIEVEMSAQFDTVKISLGELKNIEEGLVVDLTSIYDNKITLRVEDKAVARGELVIVNDRYGVKVEEVIAPGKESLDEEIQETDTVETAASEETAVTEENQPQQQEEQQAPKTKDEEEEFDYSDFELEDEDI